MIRRAFLFGELRVTDEKEVERGLVVRTQDARRLFVLLALARTPQRREVLGALMWPEVPEEVRKARLRYSLAMLRRAIGLEAVTVAGGDALALSPGIEIDVRRFWELVQEAVLTRDIGSRIEALKAALRLSQFPLLDGWKEHWVVHERYRLDVCRQDVLQALVVDLLAVERESEAALWRHLVSANVSPTPGA